MRRVCIRCAPSVRPHAQGSHGGGRGRRRSRGLILTARRGRSVCGNGRARRPWAGRARTRRSAAPARRDGPACGVPGAHGHAGGSDGTGGGGQTGAVRCSTGTALCSGTRCSRRDSPRCSYSARVCGWNAVALTLACCACAPGGRRRAAGVPAAGGRAGRCARRGRAHAAALRHPAQQRRGRQAAALPRRQQVRTRAPDCTHPLHGCPARRTTYGLSGRLGRSWRRLRVCVVTHEGDAKHEARLFMLTALAVGSPVVAP